VTVVLYRPSLSLTSGAGQLIRMQAEGLRAAGQRVRIACRRGGLRFFLRSGLRAGRVSAERLASLAASAEHVVVDHGPELPAADLVFVHNLMMEALRHLDRPDWREQAAQEARVFGALAPDVPIVANSELVKRAIVAHFRVDAARVRVLYPGFDARRFNIANRARLRAGARAELGVEDDAPLIGFVTSGDFDKRGLDIFLASAERIAAVRPDARFLVVGSKRLPEWATAKWGQSPFSRKRALTPFLPLLEYRPKSRRPERWLAALDVFLYPARFEEFGMVVAEAMASGVPVLTSRRVGAAECLPDEYATWLLEAPDASAFAEKALALFADDRARRELAALGVESAAALRRERYVSATVDLIAQRARRKLAVTGTQC
jgi:glycosyltransferase involved in cell wall biosynthesis